MIKFYGDMGAAQGISTLSDMVDALDFWQDNTIVNPGDIARSSTNSMIYAVAQTKGSTGTVEPVWGNTAGVTLTDNAVTWLVKDIRTADIAGTAGKWTEPIKINGIDVDGSHDITLPIDTIDGASYIGSGLKVSSFDGLNVNIGSGKAKIAGNGINFPGGKLALNPKKASLMYLDSTGTLGKVDAQVPTAYIDDNTVAFWLCNQTTAGANIPNIAVGKSKIAVENDLVPHGGIASVDGWADNALQFDGLTGYLSGSNTTNFPVGTAEREMSIGFNLNGAVANAPHLCGFGGTGTNQGFFIAINTSGNLCLSYQSYYDTGFSVDKGEKLIITFKYDSVNTKLYTLANGTPLGNPFTISLATIAGTFYVGNYLTGNYCAPITVDFVELRNKMRPDAKTAEIANKFIMPCFYDKTAASYPTIPDAYAAVCHEYRCDDAAGTSIVDSNTTTPLAGTATGTTAVDSDLGLGKARKFNGTSSDKITFGNFACGSAFSFVFAGTINSYTPQPLFSNRTSSSVGNWIFLNSQGNLYLSINGTEYQLSTSPVPLNTPIFIAASVSNTSVTAYANSAQKTSVTNIIPLNTSALTTYFGYDVGPYYFGGTVDYLAFGNFSVTQAEIAQIYNALMVTGRRSILDDVIPTNAISLGFIRTNSSKVIEKNDSWYKYGRREGAVGGNRKIFLPWKYFIGDNNLKWKNPFGTGKYSKEVHWAQDAKGTNELQTQLRFDSSGSYGVQIVAGVAGFNDAFNITIRACPGGVLPFGANWQSSGYLGVYIECLEDYKGADAA